MMIFEPDLADVELVKDPTRVHLVVDLMTAFTGTSFTGKVSVGKLKEALAEFSDSEVIDISGVRKKIGTSFVSLLLLLETDEKRILLAGFGEQA